jgi:hypothetical protein
MALITHRFGPVFGSKKSDRNPRECRDDNQADQQRKQISHDRADAFRRDQERDLIALEYLAAN